MAVGRVMGWEGAGGSSGVEEVESRGRGLGWMCPLL